MRRSTPFAYKNTHLYPKKRPKSQKNDVFLLKIHFFPKKIWWNKKKSLPLQPQMRNHLLQCFNSSVG